MVFFIIFFAILLNSFSWSEETSELMSQYETLSPFHENITLLMPERKCHNHKHRGKNNTDCWIDMQWEDNSEPFEELLHKTESSVDTKNPDFINTPLGQEYHRLKSFINIHKKLKSCSKEKSIAKNDILHRTQSNISMGLENPDECKSVSPISKDSIALFGKHLKETVLPENVSTESSFEDDLFSQALKTNIQSRIKFTRQTGDDNINTQSFKQKLLDKFCTENAPASTQARRTRKKETWICSEKDKEIINNIIDNAVTSANAKELIQHPTKFSHQDEECFKDQRKNKCIKTSVYEFQSAPPEPVGENQMDSLSPPVITADINYRIASLNSILEDYNNHKKELEEQWALENPSIDPADFLNLPEKRKAEHEYSLQRKKFYDQLQRIKKTFFLEYKRELALLHASGAGSLLQTDVVRNKSNFKEIEKITAKGLGLMGFEETELTHHEPFPLLEPIDDRTARLAVQERFHRMDQNIGELLSDQRNKHKTDQEYLDRLQKDSSEEKDLNKWYQDQRFDRLSKLILFSPQTINPVLLDNPEYSSVLCKVAEKIENDRQFKRTLKTGFLIGSVAGSITVAILTLGTGAPISMATNLSITTGIGLTAADLSFRISEINRHSRNQEDMLNAYLSQLGDDQSIEDIRTEWKSKVKEQVHAGWTLTLGVFDAYRIRSAINKAKSLSEPPAFGVRDNQLQNILKENNQYVESIQSLLQKHSTRSVQRLLNAVKRLPPSQQTDVLDSFQKIAEKSSFNLNAFSREIKNSSAKKNISETLMAWGICLSCKLKPGQKAQRESSDAQSVIESSEL
ncbi:MAG: hypothetical protein OXK80_04515 [Bdellovibrionales bacterium]|nr:hypothetical protein [Bdellovibrionales bacterium]